MEMGDEIFGNLQTGGGLLQLTSKENKENTKHLEYFVLQGDYRKK